jgi:hypothetical protein
MKDANELQLGVLKSRTLERELQILENDRKIAEERNKQLVEKAQLTVSQFKNSINSSSFRNSKERLKQAKIRFGEMLAASYPEWTEAVMDPVVYRQKFYFKNLEELRGKQAKREEDYARKRRSYIETARTRQVYLEELVRPSQSREKELSIERERSLSLLRADVDAAAVGLHEMKSDFEQLSHGRDSEVRRDNAQTIADLFNTTGSQLSEILSRPGTQEFLRQAIQAGQDAPVKKSRTETGPLLKRQSSREQISQVDEEQIPEPKLASLDESASRYRGVAAAASKVADSPFFFEQLLQAKKGSESIAAPKDTEETKATADLPVQSQVVPLTLENLAYHQKVINSISSVQERPSSARGPKPPAMFTYDPKEIQASLTGSEANQERRGKVSKPVAEVIQQQLLEPAQIPEEPWESAKPQDQKQPIKKSEESKLAQPEVLRHVVQPKAPAFGKQAEASVYGRQPEAQGFGKQPEVLAFGKQLEAQGYKQPEVQGYRQPDLAKQKEAEVARVSKHGDSRGAWEAEDPRLHKNEQDRPGTPDLSPSRQPERPGTPDLSPSRQPEPVQKVTTPDPELYKPSYPAIQVLSNKSGIELNRPGSPIKKPKAEEKPEETWIQVSTFGARPPEGPGNESNRSGSTPAFVIKKVSQGDQVQRNPVVYQVPLVIPKSGGVIKGAVVDLGVSSGFGEPESFSEDLPSPPKEKDLISPVSSMNSTANPIKQQHLQGSHSPPRSEVSRSSANSSRIVENPPLVCKNKDLIKLDRWDRGTVLEFCYKRIKQIVPTGQNIIQLPRTDIQEEHVARIVKEYLNTMTLENYSPMELLSMICAMGYAQESYFASPELVQRRHFTEAEMIAKMTPDLKDLYTNIKGIFEKMVESGMLSNEDAAKMFTAMILNYQTSRKQFQRVQAFVTEVFQKRAATASQVRSTGQQVKDYMGSEPLDSKALRPRSSKVDYQILSEFDEFEEDN